QKENQIVDTTTNFSQLSISYPSLPFDDYSNSFTVNNSNFTLNLNLIPEVNLNTSNNNNLFSDQQALITDEQKTDFDNFDYRYLLDISSIIIL
ncbi:hypothetical protein HDU92_006343, partial [Lobulomyces angularis]